MAPSKFVPTITEGCKTYAGEWTSTQCHLLPVETDYYKNVPVLPLLVDPFIQNLAGWLAKCALLFLSSQECGRVVTSLPTLYRSMTWRSSKTKKGFCATLTMATLYVGTMCTYVRTYIHTCHYTWTVETAYKSSQCVICKVDQC